MAAILNIAQLKKCSACPRWHQADFSSVGCILPKCAKKHLLCPKMKSCAIPTALLPLLLEVGTQLQHEQFQTG